MRTSITLKAAICSLLLPLSACPGESVGLDASTADPDAEAAGPDATAAGPDAAQPGPDAGTPPDAAMPPDAAFVPRGPGEVCTGNAECASNVCQGYFLVGNSYCSKVCKTDADCTFPGTTDTWGCLPISKTASRCFKVCESGASTECVQGLCYANVPMGSGSTMKLHGMCIDLQGLECTKESDCDATSHCSLLAAGREYAWMCADEAIVQQLNWGTLKYGEACDPNLRFDTPCRTGGQCSMGLTCVNGKCSGTVDQKCAGWLCFAETQTCGGPCAQDSDCGADGVCATFGIWLDNGTADPLDNVWRAIPFCMKFAGSRTACKKDADCPSGEVCSFYADTSAVLHTVCRKPDADGASYGDPCGDDPRTPNVVEPICKCTSMRVFDGLCSKLCETAADCGTNQACVAMYESNNQQTLKTCLPRPTCRVDADCAAGSACVAFVGPGGTTRVCVPNLGGSIPEGMACDPTLAAKAALSCPDESACWSLGADWTCNLGTHTCVPPVPLVCSTGLANCKARGVCERVCDADTDCADASFVCGAIPMGIYDNTTATPTDDIFARTKLCQKAAGSRTPCTKASDCTDASEACSVIYDGAGALKQLCLKKVEISGVTPKKPGEPCSAGIFCENDLCDFNDGDKNPATGTCAVPCTQDADCPATSKCLDLDLTADGNNRLKACRRPLAGGWRG